MFCAILHSKQSFYTKAGSGQTWGKHSKIELRRFLIGTAGVCLAQGAQAAAAEIPFWLQIVGPGAELKRRVLLARHFETNTRAFAKTGSGCRT